MPDFTICLIDRRQFSAAVATLGIVPACLAAAGGQRLRVLTYNIRFDNPADGPNAWPHRRKAMARFVADEKVDLAGFQEVLVHQARELAELLPDFEWYGVGRDDGKSKGEFSPLFFRKSRLERLDAGTFWLSPTPDQPGSRGWDAALPRVCSWLKLCDKRTGREFFAFSTHFDHRGATARSQSAALIRAQVHKIAKDAPIVLTGDFNCTAQEKPYKLLAGDAAELGREGVALDTPPLSDAMAVSKAPHQGLDSTWNGFREIQPGRRIDFVFVRKVAVAAHRIADPRVEGRFLSDHLPVIADLELE
jgi:endonuclease/exonuclease/phosphatase family metal-dependent hydrolase